MTETLTKGPTVEEILEEDVEDVSNVRNITPNKYGWKLRTAEYGANMKAFGVYTDDDEFVRGILRMTYGDQDIVDAQNVQPENLQEDYDWIRRDEQDFSSDELSDVGTAIDRKWNGYS